MILHPDGFYPHTLSSGSVFIGVLLQYLALVAIGWIIVATLFGYFVRNTARRSLASFRFGQGRARWN
jgi:hypothetical protein